MSTELELRPEERAVHGLELAERVFTPERRAAIASFLNVAPEDPAMVPYLAVCASYGLDPVMGQIWLIPQRVKVRVVDGDVVRHDYQDRYRPAVGRDGFLAIARRDKRYRGLKGTYVCERDSFEFVYDGSEDEPRVLHRAASKPTAFAADESPHRYRGKVIGAWAKAYVLGQPPMFYYAPIHEHMRLREKWEGRGAERRPVRDANGNIVMEPDGAWSYVSTMIQKSAQSYVLRIALGITGVVPVDELVDPVRADIDASAEAFAEAEFDFAQLPISEEDAQRLAVAVARVNELAPMTWPAAKCEMVMMGRSPQELEELTGRLEAEAEALASRAAQAAQTPRAGGVDDPSSGEGASGEGVTDAEVVPELTDEQQAQVASLRAQVAELEAERDRHPAGSEEWASAMGALEALDVQLRAIEDPSQAQLL